MLSIAIYFVIHLGCPCQITIISAKKKIPSLFSLLLLPRLFPLPLWPFKAILFLDFWVFFPPIHSGTWCQNAYDSTDYKVSTHNELKCSGKTQFFVSYIDSKVVKSSKNLLAGRCLSSQNKIGIKTILSKGTKKIQFEDFKKIWLLW